jgi:two-component system OmpR family response regulator
LDYKKSPTNPSIMSLPFEGRRAMQLRIFLVEDNPLIRTTFTEMLQESAGAEVIAWASSEPEAIAGMHGTDWNVALVDMFLTEGSGLGVAHAFMDRPSHQRLFVVSNYATAAIRERCSKYRVDAVFDKSTELDQLLTTLAALK